MVLQEPAPERGSCDCSVGEIFSVAALLALHLGVVIENNSLTVLFSDGTMSALSFSSDTPVIRPPKHCWSLRH